MGISENLKSFDAIHKNERDRLLRQIDELERQVTSIKAKEYDKVDFIKKMAELEARITYFSSEKDIYSKEKIRMDKEIITLGRDKQ